MDKQDRLDPSATSNHRDSVSSDPRVIEEAKQFLDMLEQGTAPTTEAFCARYPDIANSLAPCIAGLAFLNQRFQIGRESTSAPSIDLNTPVEVPSALGDFRILKEIGKGWHGGCRHSGQVAVAFGFSILAALGLLITIFVIAGEQHKTASALERKR